MSDATAARAIDLLFKSPSPTLKIEFQGGEPFLNFDRIRSIVEQIVNRNNTEQRELSFVIASSLAPLTDDMLAFIKTHRVALSTSLDGPTALHDRNRPSPARSSHTVFEHNLRRARVALGHDRVSALMTTTAASLEQPEAIVDEYVRLGFNSIFLRAISPYGFARRGREANRYDAGAFVDFYKVALRHIIDVNRNGYGLVETYAQILLQKMLTPYPTGYVDLQSPSGLGIGAVVYNYDGGVYASDEGRMLAEMGDNSFKLGDVTDSFESLFGGPLLQSLVEGSCHETMPGCSECAFSPFCGADPVFHWAVQGDPVGHRPTSDFCRKNFEIIRHLLELLRHGDDFTKRLLHEWAFGHCDRPVRICQ
jgi:His-Xaa-Ser system radical SAM maturase HxsB